MKRRWILTAASMFLGIVSATELRAQPRPMPPDPYDPQTQHAAAMNSSQPAYPASNDYPAAEVQAVPAAKAHYVASKAEYEIAHSSLIRVIDQLKEDFQFSANYAAAVDAENAAYTRYANARDRVLDQVASNPDYQTFKSMCEDLNNRLYNLKANPTDNRAEIVASAQLKLVYAKKLSRMECDALRADSETQDAKAKLVEASAKASQMRADFQRSIRRDEKFVAARKDVDNARVERVAASAMYEGALEARDIALNYAWWLHRYDPYTYRYTGNNYYDPYYNVGYVGYGSTVGGYGSTVVGYDQNYRHSRWR